MAHHKPISNHLPSVSDKMVISSGFTAQQESVSKIISESQNCSMFLMSSLSLRQKVLSSFINLWPLYYISNVHRMYFLILSKAHWGTFPSFVLSLCKHTEYIGNSVMHAECQRKSRTIESAMSSGVWPTVWANTVPCWHPFFNCSFNKNSATPSYSTGKVQCVENLTLPNSWLMTHFLCDPLCREWATSLFFFL